jgi:hypothetical protein
MLKKKDRTSNTYVIALVAKNEKWKFALIELAYQIKTLASIAWYFYRVVLRTDGNGLPRGTTYRR